MNEPSTSCPTCGQDLPANLIQVDLSANAIIAGGLAVVLTPREAEIADLLWRARPRTLTVEYIGDRVFRDGAEGTSYIPTLVFRLRKKMLANGLPVWIKSETGRGYRWIDFIGNAAVKAACHTLQTEG